MKWPIHLALPLISLAMLSPKAATGEPLSVRSDDEAVLEAALLAFFAKSSWNSVDWSQGEFVFFNPVFASKYRPEFDQSAKGAQWSFLNWPKASIEKYPAEYRESKAEAAKLEAILKAIKPDTAKYSPAAIPNPRDLKLDPRIIVDSFPGRWFADWDKRIRNRLGQEGRARVSATLYPPGYSEDGKYAVVKGHAPWSMHSADFKIFLRREGKDWKVVVVQTTFYV